MSLEPTTAEKQALAALDCSGGQRPVAGTFKLPLTTLDLAALASVRAAAKQFAIERIAPLAEVTLFTGAGSTGKSLLGQQLATAAAAGLPCLGLDVQDGAAIYLTCEDDADQLHWRQQHICEAMGADMAALAGKLHLVSLRGKLDNELGTFVSDGALATTNAYVRLREMIAATGTKLVFLDNLAHLFVGNENDRGEVTRFVNLLNRLAGDTGAAILLLGHPNKNGDNYSGSTAWLNAVRSQVTISRDDEGDDPDVRVLTIGKANYARTGDEVRFRWHNWAFIRDEDLPADTRAELNQVIKCNAENAAFLRCLALTVEQKRAVSHNPGSNYAPKVFAAMTEGKKLKEQSYRTAMERLLHTGLIGLDQPLWRGPNRVMKQGIKLTENCTDPPAPTPCTDPHETRSNAARSNPPLTYGYNGQADGPPAHNPESENSDERR